MSWPWIPSGEQSGLLDVHRGDGKRFVVRADEKLTAFVELELQLAVKKDGFLEKGVFSRL